MKYIKTFAIIVVALFLFKSSYSQFNNSEDHSKYEISLGIIPFFSEYKEWVGQFKIFKYNDEKLTGAFRFSINSQILYFSHNEPDLKRNSRNLKQGILFGYEKYLNPIHPMLYYGVDGGFSYNLVKANPISPSTDRINYGLTITPFCGIRKQIFNSVSLSFEVGLTNYFSRDKEIKNEGEFSEIEYGINSVFALPYSLAINYKF